jgi:hypothetical protein
VVTETEARQPVPRKAATQGNNQPVRSSSSMKHLINKGAEWPAIVLRHCEFKRPK